MAWGSHAERRAAVLKLAEKAEARAIEHRAREKSCRAQGKAEKAKGHAATAKRQERLAQTHRQELDRLDLRKRAQDSLQQTSLVRREEMERAKERAEAAAAARPAVDALLAYREALTTAASLEEDAKRLDKNARAYSRVGDSRKTEIASGGAARNRTRAGEWRQEAERIQAGTDRDLARELEVSIKAIQRVQARARKEEERLAHLGIDAGLATAAAQREIASGGRKRGTAVASMRSYAELIRKPQERTRERLDAMEDFDNLCGAADAGLFPEPRFEHESGSGKGAGSRVMDARISGLWEMSEIERAIGAPNVAMLRGWINQRQTLTALTRAGYGTERTISRLLLVALDALAAFLKTGNALAAHRAASGERRPTRSEDAVEVSPAGSRSPGADTETANSP